MEEKEYNENLNNVIKHKIEKSEMSKLVNFRFNTDDIELTSGEKYKCNESGNMEVGCAVTQQQVRDLHEQWGIDVVKMIENATVNELLTTLVRKITAEEFALGWENYILNGGADFEEGDETRTFKIYTDDLNSDKRGEEDATGLVHKFSEDDYDKFYYYMLSSIYKFQKINLGKMPNFIVTNIVVGSYLTSGKILNVELVKSENMFGGELYCPCLMKVDGQEIPVIIDPKMAAYDSRILFGRTVDGEDGIYYNFDNNQVIERMNVISEATMAPKVTMKMKMSSNYLENYSDRFYTTVVSFS